MVRFDAYSATMRGAHSDDVGQVLFDLVGLSGQVYQSKGHHNFGQRVGFKDSGGHEVGSVQFGGKQGDLIMVEVKGEYTPKAVEAIRARFPHRVTRVDSCADFDAPGAFTRLLGACTTIKRQHRILGGKAGDWDDFPEKGRTLYLGSTQSPVRLRLYEKGKQAEYAHLDRPDWARLEVQVRPKKLETGQQYAELDPMQVWGAGRWTRDIAATVLQEHVDPHPAGTTYRLSDRETALRWMCKQYGSHLVSLAQDLGGWDCVGLTLSEILADQKKGR